MKRRLSFALALTLAPILAGVAVQAAAPTTRTVHLTTQPAESSCGGGLTASECAAELAESTTDNGQEPECFEDQPCWRCEDMGNRICGPLPETF